MIRILRQPSLPAILLLAGAALLTVAPAAGQTVPAPKNWTTAEDHRNMTEQLGIKALRPGPSGNEAAPNHANYDEAAANPFPDYPEILKLKDGRPVTTPKMWWKERRPEIIEDFEREVLGRVPPNAPNWKYFIPWATRSIGYTAPPPPPIAADIPVPRTDVNSLIAHAQLIEKAKKGRIDVYFEGDSITRRWGAADYPQLLANWKRNFFGWNAADFGWGGDRIQNILWRLANGELDDVNPKIVVLLAGTNNVGSAIPAGTEDALVADVTRGMQAVVTAIRSKAPDATVVLMGIFPRNDNMAAMPVINRINGNLAKMAGGKVRFLSINEKLADARGRLFDGMMNADKLHPAEKGYQVWADALKPVFQELLGPPGTEDHAPPPTGDPSAQRRKSL